MPVAFWNDEASIKPEEKTVTHVIHDRVAYQLVDHVARIELAHSGGHNSLDRPMGEALRIAAGRAADDAHRGDARVVVVCAQGRVFSVGGDLSDFAGADDRGAQIKATADELHAALAMIRRLRVPVVSVINGTAAGGGLGFALIGDIVIAANEAKLVMAYTASGLTPDCGVTWLVAARVSWPRAMDLALSNRVVTGAEAAEWGLVSRAVPAAELDAAVEAVVSTLRVGPTGALADTKRLMAESTGRGFVDQLDLEAATISRAIVSPDGIEGVDAFLAKRRPVFG
ncbi:enoyl-CoA hydratase-related protein [Streptomyces sp. NBC_00631]|uniref:enoyl-CoA hydratase/isomerase family protein n=1 Tax=Streptomyces sp. NBC_00631 TaxID=2975793 RepID=UPI0030DE60C2